MDLKAKMKSRRKTKIQIKAKSECRTYLRQRTVFQSRLKE